MSGNFVTCLRPCTTARIGILLQSFGDWILSDKCKSVILFDRVWIFVQWTWWLGLRKSLYVFYCLSFSLRDYSGKSNTMPSRKSDKVTVYLVFNFGLGCYCGLCFSRLPTGKGVCEVRSWTATMKLKVRWNLDIVRTIGCKQLIFNSTSAIGLLTLNASMLTKFSFNIINSSIVTQAYEMFMICKPTACWIDCAMRSANLHRNDSFVYVQRGVGTRWPHPGVSKISYAVRPTHVHTFYMCATLIQVWNRILRGFSRGLGSFFAHLLSLSDGLHCVSQTYIRHIGVNTSCEYCTASEELQYLLIWKLAATLISRAWCQLWKG